LLERIDKTNFIIGSYLENTKQTLKNFLINVAILPMKLSVKQKGVTMMEYALVAALVAIAAIATLTSLGSALTAKFSAVVSAVAG